MEMAKRLVVFPVVKGVCYKCKRDRLIQKSPLGLQTDTCFSRSWARILQLSGVLGSVLRETTTSHKVLGFCCQQFAIRGTKKPKLNV